MYWLSLGELSKLIETFKREGITQAVMAGQVKHKQIFSSIRPDWRLAKVILSLGTRNTDSLIGAVAKVLADEGITLMSSTDLLEPLLAKAGVLTRRAPSEQETQGHRLWTVGCPSCRPTRYRTNCCRSWFGLCCRGGDGRNGRLHRARGTPDGDAAS